MRNTLKKESGDVNERRLAQPSPAVSSLPSRLLQAGAQSVPSRAYTASLQQTRARRE